MQNKDTTQKKWVWVPCEKEFYKPGYIVEEDGDRVRVQSDDLMTYLSTEVHRMNPGKLEGVENLSSLSHLNEPAVLHSLRLRYEDAKMYTYSGLFLLALNPYRKMNVYGEETKKRISTEKNGDGEPHIFSVARQAYTSMLLNKTSQSILITGESGAGKTENTKRVIEYLSYVAGGKNLDITDVLHNTNGRNIHMALSAANPLLEAFGNAKTIKNDNSSRFGKFIQIKFKDGQISGAKIEKYLLEKSRVTSAAIGERNFHAFYYLLAGASKEELETFGLIRSPAAYGCLKDTVWKIDGVDDAEEYGLLKTAFTAIGIQDPMPYFKTIAAILHLSNVDFIENDKGICQLVDNVNPCEITSIKDWSTTNSFEIASQLLNVNSDDFLKAIISPILIAGGEHITHHRSRDKALAIVEGLMKILYDALFNQLIGAINNNLDVSSDAYIGILDIAGFEIFQNNSFEQLCINYTNEKLQQFFNHHMFILEQEIYRREKIEWDFIDFGLDLQPTINTIEAANPIGLLSYLDEECVMPCATDSTLLNKLSGVEGVERVPFKDAFAIKHYAGRVEYTVKDWLHKNKDIESEALLKMINLDRNTNSTLTNTTLNTTLVKKGNFKTVAQSHREGLKWLMNTLCKTQPHFVRCILPNLRKSPELFDKRLIIDQLRCNGVLEGIRISRLGYPSRLLFTEFIDRYESISSLYKDIIITDTNDNENYILPKDRCINIIDNLKLNKNSYRIGKTLVFFRQGVIADLEEIREKKIQHMAREIQNIARKRITECLSKLSAERHKAISLLQANARHSLNLLKWNWWGLFLKIQPLLDVKKSENDLRALESKIEEYKKTITVLEERLVEKEREITGGVGELSKVRLDYENLIILLNQKESELEEQVGILNGLRIENNKLLTLGMEIKEKNDIINRLESEISKINMAVVASNNEVEKYKYTIGELHQSMKNKEVELELMIKKDLGSVVANKEQELKCKENELCEIREKMQVSAKLISELQDRLKESQNEVTNYRTLEGDLRKQVESLTGILESSQDELRQSGLALNKVRGELENAQLENDKFQDVITQMEYQQETREKELRHLEQELKFQKTRNESLETSMQTLSRLSKEDKATGQDDILDQKDQSIASLNSQVKKLTTRLNLEQKRSGGLLEEKEALYAEKEGLYAENLRLTQTRLDELFSREAEFNAAKTAMATEIRRLEGENKMMKSELAASQSSSECSDDFGFERLAQMLEDERKQRRVADARVIELEGLNARLETQAKNLEKEKQALTKSAESAHSTEMLSAELSDLRTELKKTKACLKTISTTFQTEFFDILGKKDDFYNGLINGLKADHARIFASHREETRKQVDKMEEAAQMLKKRVGAQSNELEAAAVASRVADVKMRELKEHIAKLEHAYNEREEAVAQMRANYLRVVEEFARKRDEYADGLREARRQLGNRANFTAAIQSAREASNERIAALIAENERLRTQWDEGSAETQRLRMENEELLRINDQLSAMGEQLPTPTLAELQSERLVSTFVVDPQALKASEWSSLVAQKCKKCAERSAAPSAEVRLESDASQAAHEISELTLKLRQAERIIEENQCIIEGMRSCMAVTRKTKH